jgi:hypothetical protein
MIHTVKISREALPLVGAWDDGVQTIDLLPTILGAFVRPVAVEFDVHGNLTVKLDVCEVTISIGDADLRRQPPRAD